MSAPQTIDDLLADLRARPHIDISRLPVGATIIVETTQGIIEMVVLNPTAGLVRVSGTDPKIREPVNCQMTQSFYDLEGKVRLPKWIGKEMRMQLTFKNASLNCSATVSAVVRGKGWHYDVF
jgi:phenolic acid decarboxylase